MFSTGNICYVELLSKAQKAWNSDINVSSPLLFYLHLLDVVFASELQNISSQNTCL